MDTDDDMPLFLSGSNNRRVEYSDSEDDTLLSSTLDHDGLEGLNVSDKIKNIMSIDNFYMDNTTFDDENNALFELPDSVKNRETASTSEATENQFMNFPFNKPESPPPAPPKKKRASAKKPKEKKRKRDRGKKKEAPKDIMERPVNHERTTAFLKELAQEMDSSDDDEQSGRLYRPKPKKTRKGRKPKSLQQLDENGEQMIRTTDILDDTSSSEEDEKRMTKRDELEMYRETDRLRREANISIKPTFHKKSFNDLFSKLASRKRQTEHTASSSSSSSPPPPQATLKKPMTKQDKEFDDDLEIVGAPTNMLSPEKSKASAIPWSPVATSNSSHKRHNQQLRDRIAQHMYARRKEMEEAAMSRGEYTSATDRAMKTLQREKENELIYLEVNKHFSKNKNNGNSDDDDDEEDGDYDGEQDEQEEGYDDDDIMAELSGQEEEDEEEEEQKKKDKSRSTHKDGESDENEDDDDDMATIAFKRWKRKPGKKSIFDDDEDEAEKPRIEPKKPEPKHSIAKFFQNNTKNTVSATESIVSIENKPLSRLKQKEEEEEEEEEQVEEEEEDDDAMDIDQEPSKPEQRVTFAPLPKKPLGPKPKSQFLEEEAEEEEDEHFGAGGPDADETEDLDQFEDDGLLVERNEETDNVDEAALKEIYSEQMMEKDKNMIDRLMKDITSGGLRRRKAAAENGLMLDDFDIYDNDEDDLIAIRRAAAAKRRKMLLESGDVMERLASNPKTAAFAKAAQTVLDEESRVYLSDSEEEVEEVKYKSNSALVIEESEEEVEEEDDDEEEEEEGDKKNRVGEASFSVPLIIKENRMEHVEEEETSFTELDIEVQTMARPNASPLAPHLKPFFLSPGKMDRFKSLLGDGRLSFGGSNDSGGARVGFGAPVPKKDKGKQPVRGFVPSKTDKKAAKSRLSGVMSSRADSFT